MENYIQILGKKIELTKEQVEEIKKGMADERAELGSVPVGESCKIGDFEFIVMEHSAETTAILLKDLLHDKERFGSNNNFNGSNIDNLCDTFYEVIAEHIGRDAFVEHTVDLTSDDGLKDYGKIKRKMSILTTELYRRYVDILDKYKPDKWWWLSTPYSTERHDGADWVKCVSPRGYLNCGRCNSSGGVRPFCILKSNILVTC